MRLSEEERVKNEPLCIGAVKSRLAWIQYRLLDQPLTSEDFEVICEAEQILLIREPRKWEGAYFKRKGVDVIYINSNLEGTYKTFVEFHELAHYCLHDPDISLIQFFQHSRLMIDKAEREATMISVCAIIPTCYVESFSRNELLEVFGLKALVDYRLEIYREHKI